MANFYNIIDRHGEEGVLTVRTLGCAFAVHLAVFLLFWAVAKVVYRPPEVIIPIDMTVVPPWAEQTDDPDPDPNPPPKPEEVKPPPPKPEPTPKIEQPKVEAVEQIKEKPKPPDLKKNAKLVKTPPKPPEKKDLRKNAKKIDAPIKKTGKGTAADKPLSQAEFLKKMNEGYRIGARNQLATSEEQRCVSLIAAAIRREWDRESFTWYAGLQPLQVSLKLGAGGRVVGYRILRGSGDAAVDRTANSALRRLTSISGLSATFLNQFPEIAIEMVPTQGGG